MDEQENVFGTPESTPEQQDKENIHILGERDILSNDVMLQMLDWLYNTDSDATSPQPDWTWLPTPPENEQRFMLPGLPGLFTISFETGTGTTFTGANGVQYHFRLSGASTNNVRINFPDASQTDDTERLADEILRALDGLNNPTSAAKTHEMLTSPKQNAPKPVRNTPEKPVRWKKSERNRLKFYKWLTEQGVFNDDMYPEETEALADVLQDVAETDAHVPPVPRLSDHGAQP